LKDNHRHHQGGYRQQEDPQYTQPEKTVVESISLERCLLGLSLIHRSTFPKFLRKNQNEPEDSQPVFEQSRFEQKGNGGQITNRPGPFFRVLFRGC
jgi:hypothetical protein